MTEKELQSLVADVVSDVLSGKNGKPGPSGSTPRGRDSEPARHSCDLPLASKLKERLKAGEAVFGAWITLESPTLTEIAARLGFDWIVIDAEHGHLDLRNIMEHVRVANLAGIACLVRVADLNVGLIKRVMDLGADGILIPQIRSAAEVREAVQYAKYPPEGVRGIGAERSTRWARGIERCVPLANERTLVIPLIETAQAGEAIDEIAAVEGVDAFFFGPHDFSATSGNPGAWDDPAIMKRLLAAQGRLRKQGIPCGIMAFGKPDVERRLREGFRMVGLGMDTGFFIKAATDALLAAGREIPADAWE